MANSMPGNPGEPGAPKRVVGVYDRPKSADRPPVIVWVIIALLAVASVIWFLWSRRIIHV